MKGNQDNVKETYIETLSSDKSLVKAFEPYLDTKTQVFISKILYLFQYNKDDNLGF